MKLPTLTAALIAISCLSAAAQQHDPPDRGEPGDEMIQAWLAKEAERLHQRIADDMVSLAVWEKNRPRYREEYLYMLGLWPLPARTELKATVTGTIEGKGFVVEKLHYQSKPHLYVTGNLYRPAERKPGEKLPAVFYVCGHSGMGRNGNKTAYQSHGIWFARHGYVCLVVDSLQLGEIAAKHHGTYNLERWWWHSRGYTPAGVECWNGVRGIDYLCSRDDVDPERIAVTGISGGGAATFWIAAADERVRAAVPVSGMADLPSYVSNRVINGHCDCMFLHNAFGWPWTRIAALIAPRPQLFVNSHLDSIFPMDANERVIASLERIYAMYGAGDRVDSLVSLGGHDYRRDIRQGAYRFIDSHLKGDPREVMDSEIDLVEGRGAEARHPIAPERLRVFTADSDLPPDELNTTIDDSFVPMVQAALPDEGKFAEWKASLVRELRRVVFGALPERIEPAHPVVGGDPEALETEPGIRVYLRQGSSKASSAGEKRRILLRIASPRASAAKAEKPAAEVEGKSESTYHETYVLETRGVGRTRWTRKNPPNYVERAHVLLGRTVDTGRVWDTIAVARQLKMKPGVDREIHVEGSGASAAIAVFSALLDEEISGVVLDDLPESYRDPDRSAQFLNLLRVCGLDDAVGLLAPRPVWLDTEKALKQLEKARQIYARAGAAERISVTR